MRAISLTKTYKCKVCKSPYAKRNTWQSLCGSESCAIKVANNSKAKRERLDRAETKQKLADMAKKPELAAKAQKAFNDYIRARDYGLPCICCDKPIPWGTTKTAGGVCDAGHYMSRGAHTQHKFNEDNCHAQLKYCNSPRGLGGNYANYRIGLIKRIGLERVEALECDHKLHHYTKDELREIKATYKQKLKSLTALQDMVRMNQEMGLYETP